MAAQPRILICVDKFRGSLDAHAVAEALKAGFKIPLPEAQIRVQPLADGGEGTYILLTQASQGTIQQVCVQNALGQPVYAQYGYAPTTRTAFLEMSQASGLDILAIPDRNPLYTHTFGTGTLLLEALKQGARHIVMGIGGSATNDGGMGMACALGYRFLDHHYRVLSPCGANLEHVAHIDASRAYDLTGIDIQIACDVANPLFGKHGAARVYAPQKGATPAMVDQLDRGLQHFANIVHQDLQVDAAGIAGAGAAGGLGYGAVVFLGATLARGIDLVLAYTNLESLIQQSDLLITGEGKLDTQTLQGKVVSGVAQLARKHRKPVIGVCGTLQLTAAEVQAVGLDYAESILTQPMTLEAAQSVTTERLTDWAARFGYLYLRCQKSFDP